MTSSARIATLGCLLAAAATAAQLQEGLLPVKAKQLAFEKTSASAIAARDLVEKHRSAYDPQEPELLEALSWVGRAGVFAEDWSLAEQYGDEAYAKSKALAAAQGVDSSPYLATALGAAVEVLGKTYNAQGERARAVSFIRDARKQYAGSSIETRIQKNLLLIDLEGGPMPALDTPQFVGKNHTIDIDDKVALFYFWAHWCSDCRRQKPIIESLYAKYGDQGFTVVGPTQYFGYAAAGRDATPEQELAYLEGPWQSGNELPDWMPVPVSSKNWMDFGVSTTPTLVLVDRQGVVRLYHPGRMTEEELEAAIQPLL